MVVLESMSMASILKDEIHTSAHREMDMVECLLGSLSEMLQGALAGFCLIRRVSRHEFATASEVPYGGGNVMLVGSSTNEIERYFISPCTLLH